MCLVKRGTPAFLFYCFFFFLLPVSRVCRGRFVECKQRAMPRVTISLFLFCRPIQYTIFIFIQVNTGWLVNRYFLFVFFMCNKPEVLFRLKRWELPSVKKTADSDIKVEVMYIVYFILAFTLVIMFIDIIIELNFTCQIPTYWYIFFTCPLICMYLGVQMYFRLNLQLIPELGERMQC